MVSLGPRRLGARCRSTRRHRYCWGLDDCRQWVRGQPALVNVLAGMAEAGKAKLEYDCDEYCWQRHGVTPVGAPRRSYVAPKPRHHHCGHVGASRRREDCEAGDTAAYKLNATEYLPVVGEWISPLGADAASQHGPPSVAASAHQGSSCTWWASCDSLLLRISLRLSNSWLSRQSSELAFEAGMENWGRLRHSNDVSHCQVSSNSSHLLAPARLPTAVVLEDGRRRGQRRAPLRPPCRLLPRRSVAQPHRAASRSLQGRLSCMGYRRRCCG